MLQNVNKVLFSYRLASKDKATKDNIGKMEDISTCEYGVICQIQ